LPAGSQLEIFNALWDVLSPHQNVALLHGLCNLQRHSREDGNQLLRHHYTVALQLELQLFPIQDPASVARFLAMLDGLGADAMAELIQMIEQTVFIMPKNQGQDIERQQNNGMDLDMASAHNGASTSGSDATTTEADSSQSNVEA
jgi:hypothetical protein